MSIIDILAYVYILDTHIYIILVYLFFICWIMFDANVSHVSIIINKDKVGLKNGVHIIKKNMYWYGCRPRAASRTGNDKVTAENLREQHACNRTLFIWFCNIQHATQRSIINFSKGSTMRKNIEKNNNNQGYSNILNIIYACKIWCKKMLKYVFFIFLIYY